MPDYTDRKGGDSGHDFKTIIGTVDVKTISKTAPPFLLVEKGKKMSTMADILVLARFDDENTALLGWVYSIEILQCPTRTFGHGIEDYYLPISQLRPISDLKVEILLALQKRTQNFTKRFVYGKE